MTPGCDLQKLTFPYEWFDSFEKLNHKGPVKYEDFFSSLKGGITISQEEYQNFCDEFSKRGCVTMEDWLKEYNLADVKPFIEALEKTREQYYPDEIDLLKDAVSIPGISMTYVLNEAEKRKKYSEPALFAPGEPCKCKCSDDCEKARCEKCKEVQKDCETCTKNEAYEILTTGMVGGPSIVFCRYAEAGVSRIRSHRYSDSEAGAKLRADTKTCRAVLGLDANSLYLFCSGQEMLCGKEKVFSSNPEEKDKLIQNVLNDKLFGFFQVDIEVPEQLLDKFSEFSPLFILSEVPEDQIPHHIPHQIIKPDLKELYKDEKKKWLVTDEYSKRVPGLFKPEFKGKRMIALTSKCYFADNGENGAGGIPKFSCKGVSRRQNKMSWERYRNALFGALDKVTNVGFQQRSHHIVTYEQTKLGLSAYYDKRIVHEDGIHTSCLRAQSSELCSSLRASLGIGDS